MNPRTITYDTTGVKDPLNLDWRIVPFSAHIGVVKNTGGGTLSLTLEGTLDDVNDASITPVWFSLGAAITATGLVALTAPIQFIRANIATLTGTTVTLKTLQGESIN